MKIDYEKPELLEAEFGKFITGNSMPGGESSGKGDDGDDL